jgi:hypothetical protein
MEEDDDDDDDDPQISNFIKIHPVGAKLFHVGGCMDR